MHDVLYYKLLFLSMFTGGNMPTKEVLLFFKIIKWHSLIPGRNSTRQDGSN